MNFRNFRIISAFVGAALIISACEKEVSNPNQTPDETPTAVPFFELAKGDTIAKGIYREKPDFVGVEEAVVLFTTESKLKTTGYSGDGGPGIISDLYVSIRSENDAPYTMGAGSDKMYKIPVDLNESAGGYWIYLYGEA